MVNPRGGQLGEIGELQAELADLREEVQELGRLRVADNVTEDWLQIPFRFVGLASGATAVLTRTVSGDGPYDLIEVTSTAISSTGIANDSWRVRIKEGEAVGRALTQDSEFVDLANTSGTGQRPYIIKIGRASCRERVYVLV